MRPTMMPSRCSRTAPPAPPSSIGWGAGPQELLGNFSTLRPTTLMGRRRSRKP
jgi:hypothetical protein